MSRLYKFHSSEVLPVVTARLFSGHKSKLVRLVFDTGAATTQIHTPIIDALGYSAGDGIGRIASYGPAGPIQDGYTHRSIDFGLKAVEENPTDGYIVARWRATKRQIYCSHLFKKEVFRVRWVYSFSGRAYGTPIYCS